MIYQDYFRNSNFEDIWTILSGFYMEHEALKPQYCSQVEAIKSLPVDSTHSVAPIEMCLDLGNEIMVKGAPDPQEWLLGREVKIDFSSWRDKRDEEPAIETTGLKTFDMLSGKEKRQLARESDTTTLAAHLLYWSTLYAIKTQGQHRQEFYAWLDSLKKGKVSYEIEKEYVSESRRRKQRKYWRETVINDSAIYWAWNLTILKKKLEYNIGYWRYVQRHVGWQEDVNRMLTAVGLINLAETEYPEIKGKHINQRTATKYTREPISEAPEMEEFDLSRLYRDKAFHILWKWLDHNMKDWWD